MQLILTTCPKGKANELSKKIVEGKLAGCAIEVESSRSLFFWEGKICEENETLIIFKTPDDVSKQLMEKLGKIHPYETPFIAKIKVDEINKGYEKWLNSVVKGKSK